LEDCCRRLGDACVFELRVSTILWEVNRSLTSGSDGVPPYAELSIPLMGVRQPYDISLHLAVPRTESNVALGNFMASMTLVTRSNQTLISVRKPV
jgi:hypothetical protein